jgi:serine/threonine protein kinase/tetratricopeptide (TPR) repeat protein
MLPEGVGLEPRRGADLTSEHVGPYRLEEPLGRGGMGMVWRAWDERLKRRVAVKQIRAEATVSNLRERLRREAQAAARLNHPSIVHIYDIVEEADGDWIIMELVSGQTLRQWLDDKGPLLPAVAARVGWEIAEGLAEAHEFGILHRDLKAGNVMVTPAGRTKILDFGLAKELALEGMDLDPSLSIPGIVLGTAYAMSPEQALGRDLDARSDLFSLGALLYEALTGISPFRGDSPTASLARVLTFQPQPLRLSVPGFPVELSDLIESLLEKEPEDRPQSAREVARVLRTLAAGETGAFGAEPASSAALAHDTAILTLDQKPLRGVTGSREEAPRRSSAESGHRRTLGERRLVTVVCCGLVELEEDSGEVGFLDLEMLSESMASFQDLAREICERYSGSLSTTLGHLLWLYFGYPHAHEDDVQRAVRTARELAARIDEIGGPFGPRGKQRLALRIAVHTGPAAVVSRTGQEERLQLGSVLDLATSLQGVAPVGQVVVSGASQKLIGRDFSTETLSPVHVPGVGEPVSMHKILREMAPQDRESGQETPLVGREREIALLEDRFHLACAGFGQAVMISGEAGIGKSRLVAALRERLAGAAATWWIAYGSPYTQSSPLAPVIELLDRILSSSSEISPGDKIARLEVLLEGSPGPESVPLLASLLSIPGVEHHPPPGLGPEAQRRNLFQTLLALTAKTAELQPLVLVVEDLHWVDPSTLEFLTLLLEEIRSLPLMLIATYRPEFQAPSGQWSHRTQLGLSRLTQEEAATLVSRLTGEREVPADVRQQIIARTDGIPLFLEELTKAVFETGWTRGKADIPSTLSGSLAARLDGLGPAKEVAQIASVIGRIFSIEVLEAIAPFDAATLRKRLDELIQTGLIHRSGLGPRSRLSFKHALVQDAAYASLLAKDRQELHLKIAHLLEERELEPAASVHPGAGDNDRMVLAHHWSAAVDVRQPEPESVRKAAFYRIAAGEYSLRMGAYKEAHAQLEAALNMVERLPPGGERDRLELVVRMRLGTVLKAIRGWGSLEVHQVYRRARELCLQLDDRRELAQVLFGLWACHYMHAEYEEALEMAKEHLEAARELGPAERAMAHHALANSLLAVCRLPECLIHAEIAAALAEELDEEVFFIEYGQDPRIIAASDSCWVLWQMDLEEEALKRNEAISSVAARLAHPFNLTVAASTSMWLHRQRHAAEATLACTERLIQVSKTIGGFPEYETAAKIYRDWALAELGQAAEVVDEVLGSLEGYSRAGSQTSMASFYAMGAEVCHRAGRLGDALGLIEKGLAASRNGGLLAEVELYCLQGEILGDLARQADQSGTGTGRERGQQAEASFSRAFDLACERWQVAYLDRVIRGLSRFPGDRSREIQRARSLREEVPHLVQQARDRVAEELALVT